MLDSIPLHELWLGASAAQISYYDHPPAAANVYTKFYAFYPLYA